MLDLVRASRKYDWAPDGRRVAVTTDAIGSITAFVGLHVIVQRACNEHIPDRCLRPWTERRGPRTSGGSRNGSDACPPLTSIGRRTAPRSPTAAARVLAGTPAPSRTSYFWAWQHARAYADHRLLPLVGSGREAAGLLHDADAEGQLRGLHDRPRWLRASTRRRGRCTRLVTERRLIAYQASCGIRLVTATGRDVTPNRRARPGLCGLGYSGRPTWAGRPEARHRSAGRHLGHGRRQP